MGLRIATNTQSLFAQRAMYGNRGLQERSLEKLASGSRINRAGDDAAGLAISEKLRAHIRSMQQATRNANDGISMIQVAEGAMNEISNIMIRTRELSIQAASDTVGDTERGFIDKEVQHLKSELERIAVSTEFNGMHLLNGEGNNLDFQVGINNNPEEDRLSYSTQDYKTTLETLGMGDVSTATKEGAQNNLGVIDAAINKLNENRSGLGALQNRLQSTVNNQLITTENLSAANSRIRDTDVAEESTNIAKQNILMQSNVSMLAQANTQAGLALRLLGGNG